MTALLDVAGIASRILLNNLAVSANGGAAIVAGEGLVATIVRALGSAHVIRNTLALLRLASAIGASTLLLSSNSLMKSGLRISDHMTMLNGVKLLLPHRELLNLLAAIADGLGKAIFAGVGLVDTISIMDNGMKGIRYAIAIVLV